LGVSKVPPAASRCVTSQAAPRVHAQPDPVCSFNIRDSQLDELGQLVLASLRRGFPGTSNDTLIHRHIAPEGNDCVRIDGGARLALTAEDIQDAFDATLDLLRRTLSR
jgi:hypothetical protein